MQPAQFDYHRPGSLSEAISLLESTDGARLVAGGHSLLPAMKLRVSNPSALIDISRIDGLDGITVSPDGDLVIGALATHASVAASDTVAGAWPSVAETAGMIGDAQVRNKGTIGGSVAHADPAADYPTLLIALGAKIVATGSNGEREIAAGDFFVDLFTTSLQPGEIVTEVRIPAGNGSGAAYVKHRHPASSYAVVGVAAVVGDAGGRIVVGGATGSPVQIDGTDPGSIAGAINDPIGDVYASGEYRVHLATILAKQATATASERAQ